AVFSGLAICCHVVHSAASFAAVISAAAAWMDLTMFWYPLWHGRQYLPLHRIPEHRQIHPSRRR
ncbi:MAG: hypothetical protein AAGC81_15540, partial [Pseudomonadota bacterium]